MPWRKSGPVSERMVFITRLMSGERMNDLCAEFGISRKTGYKFKDRYDRLGPEGLFDVSRRPLRTPWKTPEPIQELVVALRLEHPTWGPKKLAEICRRRHPGLRVPAPSTIGDMLARVGLVRHRRRRRHVPVLGRRLREAPHPNDVWCVDYKGQFRLGNGRYCYPLTITDQASRLIVGCEGFEQINGLCARAVFQDCFSRYGLPQVIRSDNGPPFASRGLFGLTQLNVFWLKLGIVPERIRPGEPQENGQHERMHRTLKDDCIRPAAANLLAQQERFDRFVETFNQVRPHEALGQKPPASVYVPSSRVFRDPDPLEYPLHDDVRTTDNTGHIRLLRRRRGGVFISSALVNERIGIREVEDGRWLLSFASLDLGYLDPAGKRFEPADLEVTP